jgi:hypothetical protein
VGDYRRAAELIKEALARGRELGDPWNVAYSLTNLANVARSQGDCGQAKALFRDGLMLSCDKDLRWIAALGLEGLAAVAAAQGQPLLAARLFGAAEALREALGTPLKPSERAGYDQATQATRGALGEDSFAAAWAEGRALPLDEAVTMALAVDPVRVE